MGLSTTYTKTETDFLIQQLEKKTASGYKGDLRKSDPAPTQIGFYGLLETGIYTNLGGINAQSEKLNFASFDGTTWSLIAVDVSSGGTTSVIDGFNSTSTTSAGSANNDRALMNLIKNLDFTVTTGIPSEPSTYDTIETISNVSSFNITNNTYSSTSQTDVDLKHSGKILVFNKNYIEFSNLYNSETSNYTSYWVVFGKHTNGNYLSFLLDNTNSMTLNFVTFTNQGAFSSNGSISTLLPINMTKSFYLLYFNDKVELYQDGLLLASINYLSIGFQIGSQRFGIASVGETTSCNYTIKTDASYGTTNVNMLKSSSFGKEVVFEDATLKYKQNKKDKIITLYGDSITVAYDSANYVSGILSKTGASAVNKKGVSGQSFAGQLQLDANIATITATNPDVVILHSVNDHRNNVTIGTMADAAGTASLYGGLKKICNALISYNKNVKIILCTPLIYGQISTWPASDVANSLGKYLHDYANAMKDFASNYGITIVDLSQKCCFRPQIEATTNRVYTSDGVHPNATGYEVMTTLIAEEINKLN